MVDYKYFCCIDTVARFIFINIINTGIIERHVTTIVRSSEFRRSDILYTIYEHRLRLNNTLDTQR